MTPETLFIAAVGTAAVYPVVMRVLARVVQRKRLRMADIGSILARQDDLPHEWREMVAWMLETAYSPKTMALFAMTISLYVIDVLRGKDAPLPNIVDKNTRDLIEELTSNHIASAAAANPVFALIASLELSLISFFLYPLGKGSKGAKIEFAALVRAEQARPRLAAA